MQREIEKYLVEFIGTTFFLYVIISTGNALAIGAALALAIFVGGSISGGNFNPAVSVMMIAAGKLKPNEGICYIIAQLLGGMLALALYKHVKL